MSVHPSVTTFVRPHIRPSVHPSIRPSVRPSVHPSIKDEHVLIKPFITWVVGVFLKWVFGTRISCRFNFFFFLFWTKFSMKEKLQLMDKAEPINLVFWGLGAFWSKNSWPTDIWSILKELVGQIIVAPGLGRVNKALRRPNVCRPNGFWLKDVAPTKNNLFLLRHLL